MMRRVFYFVFFTFVNIFMRFKKSGLENNPKTGPGIIVFNHIGRLEIVLVMITTKRHDLVGWMAEKAGTLFIKRGFKGAAEQSIKDITQALLNGGHVIVFPEGTTTDGTSLGRFHSRLFQAAIDAKAQLQPVALRYPHPDGVHPKAPFIGDTQFIESLMDMISEKNMHVRLDFLDSINAQEFNRDELAELAKQQILKTLTEKNES